MYPGAAQLFVVYCKRQKAEWGLGTRLSLLYISLVGFVIIMMFSHHITRYMYVASSSYTRTHTHTHAHTRIHMHTHTHTHMHTHTRIYTHTHTHTHKHTQDSLRTLVQDSLQSFDQMVEDACHSTLHLTPDYQWDQPLAESTFKLV